MTNTAREVLAELHAAMKACHYGRMPEPVQKAYDAAAELLAQPAEPQARITQGQVNGLSSITDQLEEIGRRLKELNASHPELQASREDDAVLLAARVIVDLNDQGLRPTWQFGVAIGALRKAIDRAMQKGGEKL